MTLVLVSTSQKEARVVLEEALDRLKAVLPADRQEELDEDVKRGSLPSSAVQLTSRPARSIKRLVRNCQKAGAETTATPDELVSVSQPRVRILRKRSSSQGSGLAGMRRGAGKGPRSYGTP